MQNFDVTPGGRARGVWPQRVQNSLCTNIVMLHIKSKVMKNSIQWCKNFARWHVGVVVVVVGGGGGGGGVVIRGQKVGFWVLFLLSHNSS